MPTAVPLPAHVSLVSSSNTYDTLGRLVRTVDGKGNATTFSYDANGNRLTMTDAKNRTTRYTYDALNRLTTSTDPDNKVTRYSYDVNDNLVTVTDPEGFTTTYTYNGHGDLLKLTSPDTGVTSYSVNAAGQRTGQQDARGKAATYTRDALGRITRIDFGDAVHTFNYDTAANGVGQLGSVTDPSGSTTYAYDSLGRVIRSTRVIGGKSFATVYSYNADGSLASATYPSGIAVGYGWQQGQVGSVTLNGKPLLNDLRWGNAGLLRYQWSNGQQWLRNTDEAGRSSAIQFGDAARVYGYDPVSNITAITEPANPQRGQSYSYDNLDRLTGANVGNTTFTYGYDYNGNRTDQSVGAAQTHYTHEQASNRLQSASGGQTKAYQFDAAGNRIGDDGWVHTYNNAGRMISSTRGAVSVTYQYNALGQRVSKTSAGVTTYFVYDEAGHLIGEYDGTGKAIQETVWLGDTPVATVRPTADAANPQILYVWADHLNTPRQLSEPATQKLVWRWDGEPFGADLAQEGVDSNGKPVVYNLRFPGQYFDKETGLHYNYFRDYDPKTGRYVQSDPIGLAGGINTYGYVDGMPLNYSDPEGLTAIPWDRALTVAGGAALADGPVIPVGDIVAVGVLASVAVYNACQDDECTPIYVQITATLGELKKRYSDLIRDEKKLPKTGPMSIEGHRQQFRNKQARLRNLLNMADSRGCKNYEQDAWYWATIDAPHPGWGGSMP